MFKCPLCGHVSNYFKHLKKHFKLKHGKTKVCPICKKEVRNLHRHCFAKFIKNKDKEHGVLFALLSNSSCRLKKIKNEVNNFISEYLEI